MKLLAYTDEFNLEKWYEGKEFNITFFREHPSDLHIEIDLESYKIQKFRGELYAVTRLTTQEVVKMQINQGKF